MGVPMTVVPLRAEVTSDHVGRAGETMDGEAHAPTEAGHLDKTVGGTAPKRTSARPESRDGGVSHMSLGAKLALMVAIFLAVPVILYQQFQQADREKSQLLLESVREQGRIIAAGLAPILSRQDPSPLIAVPLILPELSGSRINTKVLYRPAGGEGAQGFFYVAASPPVSAAFLESERERLTQQGVLDQLATSCALDLPAALRYRSLGGREELITSITPVRNELGCWAIVASYTGGGLLASTLGKPYWQAPEIQLAALLYATTALIVISLFIRLWRNLSRFSRLAAEIQSAGSSAGSFVQQNTFRELAGVAAEFDRMIEALRKLSSAVERSPTSVAITDADGRIEYVNPAFTDMTGYSREEAIGSKTSILKSGETPRRTYEEMWDTISNGRVWRGELCNARRDGSLFWASVSISSSKSSEGKITHYIGLHEDITARKQVEQQRTLLLAELNHRVKNTLATVKSIATQTLRQSPSSEQFRDSFEGRLRVLAVANDLLTQTSWKGADLRTLSQRALEPFHKSGSDQVTFEGPNLMLSPKAALSFSLTLHELATNAAKYGALSAPLGKVELRWSFRSHPDGPLLVYRWRETGGPKVTAPSHRGFGTTLIEKGMAYELNGEVLTEYLEEGLRCEIVVPRAEVEQPTGTALISSPDRRG